MRSIFAGLLIVVLVPVSALVLRGWILAEWRFDTFSLQHWNYLAQLLGRWWANGQGPRLGFLAALGFALAIPPLTGFLLWRMRDGIARICILLAIPLVAIAGFTWRFAVRPLLRLAGIGILRIAERAAERPPVERQPPPGLKPVFAGNASPGKKAPAVVPRTEGAASATSSPVPAKPEAKAPESSEQTSGLNFSTPSDDEFIVADDPAADVTSAATTSVYASPNEMLQEVALWLHARKWEILHDLPVDASLEGRFVAEADAFDNDPRAVIPMIALCGTEVRLVFPVNLDGAVWSAAPWSPDRGGAEWTAEHDPTVVMRCPIGEAMRATSRFAAAFEAGLSAAGMSVVQVYPALILANGDVGNWAELVDSWPDGSIAHLERPGALDYAFGGDPVDDPVDAMLVKYLRSAGQEIVARRKTAA